MVKKREGINLEGLAALEYLRTERKKREAQIREDEREKQERFIEPIKGFDKSQNFPFNAKKQKPKSKSLEENWEQEDFEAKRVKEDKEYNEWLKRKR